MKEQRTIINEIMKRTEYSLVKQGDTDPSTNHTVFIGTPKRNISDLSKILLIKNPFEEMQEMLEFPVQSIGHIEELETISSDNGETALRVKIWVKKGSYAFETRVFKVD